MSAIHKGNRWNEHSFKEVEDYVTGRLDSIEERLDELDWANALTIEATEDNTSLAWWLPDNQEIQDDHSVTIQVSRDGGRTWTNVQSGDPREVNYNIGTLNAGEKVILKGNGPTGFVDQGGDYGNYFFANKPCYVYGNVMSLLYGADYASREGISDPSTLAYLFAGNDGSSKTWVLSKPQYPIILPATTLAESCYEGMFNGCTSLAAAPELPATTLAQNCYQTMFNGCSSLTAAPELLAATLAQNCYAHMFSGCTSLASVKCLASAVSPSNAVTNWLRNVSATGTFTKAAGVTWPSGENGIPSGWTVQEANE